jgi:calcineurin-like phosphoesterase family protein
MRHAKLEALLGVFAALSAAAAGHGCMQPECSSPLYSSAECRVVAENDLARMLTEDGIELRFQPPGAEGAQSWIAGGLLRTAPQGVQARIAGAGAFAISLAAEQDGLLELELANIDPAASVRVHSATRTLDVPARPGATTRRAAVTLTAGETAWVRSERPCPPRFRIAVTADIQTNPWQFERIVDRLIFEAGEAERAGEPIVALLIAGDLAEASRDDEYEVVADVLARLPFPAAVTAGNHDVYKPMYPQFNRNFGPGNYAFDVCDVHVAMLDSGSGTLAPSVLARLPELLDRGEAKHSLAVMHHPPYPGLTGAGWSREDHAALTLVELAAADVDLVLAGHSHALHDFPAISVGDRELHEIIVGTAGALQGGGVPRYGYLRLTFDGDTISPCFVEVPPPGYAGPPNEPLRTLDYCAD